MESRVTRNMILVGIIVTAIVFMGWRSEHNISYDNFNFDVALNPLNDRSDWHYDRIQSRISDDHQKCVTRNRYRSSEQYRKTFFCAKDHNKLHRHLIHKHFDRLHNRQELIRR